MEEHGGISISECTVNAPVTPRYSESIDILYSATTFDIVGRYHSADFFPSIFPSQHLQAVRSVRLEWWISHLFFDSPYRPKTNREKIFWKEACETIARMQNLRHLEVEVSTQLKLHEEAEVRLLEPLMAIKASDCFVVYLPRTWGQENSLLREPPFKIVRDDSVSTF